MDLVIFPRYLQGEINAMCSKSFLQRALAIASLAQGDSTLTGVRWSNDSEAAAEVIKKFGASIINEDTVCRVHPRASIPDENPILNVGESGLSLRMFSALSGLLNRDVRIEGVGSLRKRPLKPVIETLAAAGLSVSSDEGHLPLTVKGPHKGGEIHISGAFSSQVLSGLLIGLPLIPRDSIIFVSDLKSRPYIEMTLEIIAHFGVEIENRDFHQFRIRGGQHYQGCSYAIEGDWSAAANHLVAGAIGGDITMRGLNMQSKQADRAIMQALEAFGAQITVTEKTIQVSKGQCQPFVFDATHCPDIFPPLVVLAAACQGKSIISGTHRLRDKESDRQEALIDTFGRLGLYIDVREDEMHIYGTGALRGGEVYSHNDHRIAMAASIATCLTTGDLLIADVDCVEKSYPYFFDDTDVCTELRITKDE